MILNKSLADVGSRLLNDVTGTKIPRQIDRVLAEVVGDSFSMNTSICYYFLKNIK